jgi:hypothetical protein
MSVWKNKNGKTVRRNPIASQFMWLSIEALRSAAYRVMSLSGRRVLDRIQIEHASHGGQENGKLPVTFRDFHDYGMHWSAIAPAIREVAALGFIRVTQEGIASNKEFRIPNMFALTHLPTEKGQVAATDDWRRIKTIEDAQQIASAARKASARFTRFSPKAKTAMRSEKRSEFESGERSESAQNLNPKSGSLSHSETGSLSIFRMGSREAARETKLTELREWNAPVLIELECRAKPDGYSPILPAVQRNNGISNASTVHGTRGRKRGTA